MICCAMILIANSTPVKTQNIDSVLHCADELMKEGNDQLALSLAHRILFFAKEQRQQYSASMILGKTYFNLSEYKNSQKYFDKASNLAYFDSAAIEAKTGTAKALFFQEEFSVSLVLLTLEDGTFNSNQTARKNFYLGLNYFMMDQYESAKSYLSQALESKCPEYNDTLTMIFEGVHSLRNWSFPARISSAILPGSGQWMTGNWADGLNSLLLNAALITTTVYVWNGYGAVNALLSVFPWSFKYYTGGIKNAGKQGEALYNKQKKEHLQKILLLYEQCAYSNVQH